MTTPKRATVYFQPGVHKALRLRAAASNQSISNMVNDAVKALLAEDAVDVAAFDSRKRERSQSIEAFVRGERALLIRDRRDIYR
jgi:plasmid stability protein